MYNIIIVYNNWASWRHGTHDQELTFIVMCIENTMKCLRSLPLFALTQGHTIPKNHQEKRLQTKHSTSYTTTTMWGVYGCISSSAAWLSFLEERVRTLHEQGGWCPLWCFLLQRVVWMLWSCGSSVQTIHSFLAQNIFIIINVNQSIYPPYSWMNREMNSHLCSSLTGLPALHHQSPAVVQGAGLTHEGAESESEEAWLVEGWLTTSWEADQWRGAESRGSPGRRQRRSRRGSRGWRRHWRWRSPSSAGRGHSGRGLMEGWQELWQDAGQKLIAIQRHCGKYCVGRLEVI